VLGFAAGFWTDVAQAFPTCQRDRPPTSLACAPDVGSTCRPGCDVDTPTDRPRPGQTARAWACPARGPPGYSPWHAACFLRHHVDGSPRCLHRECRRPCAASMRQCLNTLATPGIHARARSGKKQQSPLLGAGFVPPPSVAPQNGLLASMPAERPFRDGHSSPPLFAAGSVAASQQKKQQQQPQRPGRRAGVRNPRARGHKAPTAGGTPKSLAGSPPSRQAEARPLLPLRSASSGRARPTSAAAAGTPPATATAGANNAPASGLPASSVAPVA